MAKYGYGISSSFLPFLKTIPAGVVFKKTQELPLGKCDESFVL